MKLLRNKSILRKLLLSSAGIAMVIFFQNCSKIQPGIIAEDLSAKNQGAAVSAPDGTSDLVPVNDNSQHSDGCNSSDDSLLQNNYDVNCNTADCSEDPAVLLAACAKAKGSAVSASGDLVELRGSFNFKANELGKVENVRGKLVLNADTTASVKVASIHDERGSLIICNGIVGEISATRGNIVLVNTTVGSISNHRGVIRSLHSTIQSVSDVRGAIKEIQP